MTVPKYKIDNNGKKNNLRTIEAQIVQKKLRTTRLAKIY